MKERKRVCSVLLIFLQATDNEPKKGLKRQRSDFDPSSSLQIVFPTRTSMMKTDMKAAGSVLLNEKYWLAGIVCHFIFFFFFVCMFLPLS